MRASSMDRGRGKAGRVTKPVSKREGNPSGNFAKPKKDGSVDTKEDKVQQFDVTLKNAEVVLQDIVVQQEVSRGTVSEEILGPIQNKLLDILSVSLEVPMRGFIGRMVLEIVEVFGISNRTWK
ncbi:hypothetical protein ACOSQ3_016930 [Xanthoceras sorbifolium]